MRVRWSGSEKEELGTRADIRIAARGAFGDLTVQERRRAVLASLLEYIYGSW
jgi:hypothetical protein